MPNLSVLYCAFKTNVLVSNKLTLANNFSYTIFFSQIHYLPRFLVYLNQKEQISLTISVLSTWAFEVVKFYFATKLDVSTPATLF